MLDNKGFDLWADGYDKTVGVSDEENTYPFAGYRTLLSWTSALVPARLQRSCMKTAVRSMARTFQHG